MKIIMVSVSGVTGVAFVKMSVCRRLRAYDSGFRVLETLYQLFESV